MAHCLQAIPDADSVRDDFAILQHKLLLPNFLDHALRITKLFQFTRRYNLCLPANVHSACTMQPP